jgi:hypothetical protein
MIINLSIDRQYGKIIYRPNCDTSRKLCGLLGQLTLTEDNISRLKDMGYKVTAQHGGSVDPTVIL